MIGAGLPSAARGGIVADRRRRLRIWWRETDRVLLFLVLALMGFGALAVAAASPASAQRLSTPDEELGALHFFWLHLNWQVLGLAVLFTTAMLEGELARRLAITVAAAMLAALMLVPLIGTEVNGARRWLDLGVSFQPSEFLKPAFAVTLAWILSWKQRDASLPVLALGTGLLGLIVALLMAQPNFGEAMLFIGLWLVLVLLAGIDLKRFYLIGAAGLAAIALLLVVYENGRNRILSFFFGGTAYDQVDLAARTLEGGGWGGTGFWLGTHKMRLPEAHTDYIFSVIGEEFGLVACAIVVMIYLGIVARVVLRLIEEERLFTLFAASGLVALFAGQAFINIMVNLQLFPSKGMTLPLISYGGSSTIAQCFTIGLLLAITRRNPYLARPRFQWRSAFERGMA